LLLHQLQHFFTDVITRNALVTDGIFLQSGYFFIMLKETVQLLTDRFRAHVLKLLKKENLIDDTFITLTMQ